MSLRGSPNPKYQKNKSSLTIKTTKTNNENNHTERRRKIFHLGAWTYDGYEENLLHYRLLHRQKKKAKCEKKHRANLEKKKLKKKKSPTEEGKSGYL